MTKKAKKNAWSRSHKFCKSLFSRVSSDFKQIPAAFRYGGILLLVLASGFLLILAKKRSMGLEEEANLRKAEILAGPRVELTHVGRAPASRVIHATGEARPYATVTLYAKVSGYLKDVRVDKGDSVKKGQILAVIQSPETDEAYLAALAEAKNKKHIGKRMRQLQKQKLVSAQEAEQAISDEEVSSARLDTQAIQKGYETLKAPFDGTITARFADPGALVQNATNSQTSALPVVTISKIDQLRIYVYLDQKDASFVAKGIPVEVIVQEKPNLKLRGTVTRISGELDLQTKMLLTEIDLDNKKMDLVAGSFVQVNLSLKSAALLEVPVEALILKQDRPYLAVVSADQTAHFKPVELADSDGTLVHIVSGVQEGDLIALNLESDFVDGSKIRPILKAKEDGGQH